MHNVKACLLSLPSYTKKKKPSATLSFTCLPKHARTHSTFSHTCQIGCQQLISLLPSCHCMMAMPPCARTPPFWAWEANKDLHSLSQGREGREGGRPLLQHTFPLASSPSDLRTQSGTYSRRRGKGIKGVQTLLLLPPPPLWHQGGGGETGERRGEYPSFPLFSSTFLSSFSLTTTSALGDIALSLFSSLGAVVDDEIKDGAVFPLEVAVVLLLLLRRRVRIAASSSFLCFPLPTLSPSSSFSAVAYSCLLLLLLLFPHGFCAASSSFAGGVPTFLLLLLLAPRLLPSAQLTTTTNPERAGGGGGE